MLKMVSCKQFVAFFSITLIIPHQSFWLWWWMPLENVYRQSCMKYTHRPDSENCSDGDCGRCNLFQCHTNEWCNNTVIHTPLCQVCTITLITHALCMHFSLYFPYTLRCTGWHRSMWADFLMAVNTCITKHTNKPHFLFSCSMCVSYITERKVCAIIVTHWNNILFFPFFYYILNTITWTSSLLTGIVYKLTYRSVEF